MLPYVTVLLCKQPGRETFCGFYMSDAELSTRIFKVVGELIHEGLIDGRCTTILPGVLDDQTSYVIVVLQPGKDDQAVEVLKRECETRVRIKLAVVELSSESDYQRMSAYVSANHTYQP
jgi:hypothetical protein